MFQAFFRRVRRASGLQRCALSIVAVGTLAFAGAVLADESLEERLASGEIVVTTHKVEGFSIPSLETDAVVEVSPEKFFALVDDCDGYQRVMPRVATSSEVERKGNRSICKWTVDMPFPLANLSTVVEVNRTVTAGKWRREFKQTSGDFVRNEGVWTLTQFGDNPNRTRIDYRLHVVFDSSLPDTFIRSGQKSAMPTMIKRLRSHLKAD